MKRFAYLCPIKKESQRFPKKHHQRINGAPLWQWSRRYCVLHNLNFKFVSDDDGIVNQPVQIDYGNDDFMNTLAKNTNPNCEWTIWVNACAPFRLDNMHVEMENILGKEDLGIFVREPTVQPMSFIRSGTYPFVVKPGNTADNADISQIDFSFVYFRTEMLMSMVDVPLEQKWTIFAARRKEIRVSGVYVDIDTEHDFALARSHARTFFRSQQWSTESDSPSTK